jgi:uncharacterized membrane protein
MADAPLPVTGTEAIPSPPLSGALVAYALFGLAGVIALVHSGFPPIAPLFGLVGIVAVVICYVKRGEAQGTWVESHLRWLIRTFWFSLLWTVIGWMFFWVLLIVLIGPVIAVGIWALTAIWIIYRVVRGYLIFKESRPVPGM